MSEQTTKSRVKLGSLIVTTGAVAVGGIALLSAAAGITGMVLLLFLSPLLIVVVVALTIAARSISRAPEQPRVGRIIWSGEDDA